MNQHEYIAGFFGVLIGFTLTELIKGIAELLKNRSKVKFYLPYGLFILLCLLILIYVFFDFYQFFSMVERWTPLLLIRYAFPAMFLCFLSYLLFPDLSRAQEINLKAYYFSIMPFIFKMGISMLILVLTRNIFVLKSHPLSMVNSVLTLITCAACLTILVKKSWTQYVYLAVSIPSVIFLTLQIDLS